MNISNRSLEGVSGYRSQPKVVVTGSSGFLGTHVVKVLREQGADVTAVARRSIPHAVVVEKYSDCPEGDLLIHLAEEPDRNKVEQLGEVYFKEATDLVELLTARFAGKVIYGSSGSVYGDRKASSFREEDPVSITDLYSRLKIHNENKVLEAGGNVIRISNMYGFGMSSNNVLSKIISQIHQSEPIRLWSSRPIRDFINVEDVAGLIVRMAYKVNAQVYNAGSGVGTSIGELASLIMSAAGVKKELRTLEESTQFSSNILNIEKAETVFGWRPNLSLNENLTILMRNWSPK